MQAFFLDSDKKIMNIPGPISTLQCCTDEANDLLERIFDVIDHETSVHTAELDREQDKTMNTIRKSCHHHKSEVQNGAKR